MGLEAATYVEDLVITNPPGGDTKAQGDDHLRLIKGVLRNTLKRASKPFYFPTSIAKVANYTILPTDDNSTIYVDTSAGNVVLTAPASVEPGFHVKIIKSTFDGNSIIIQPPSGIINVVYTKVRRSAPFVVTELVWVGVWVATRHHGIIPGSVVPYWGVGLPPGYLWADGSSFVADDFQELFIALANRNVLPDLRGRVPVGRDNMGVGAAGIVTAALSGIAGTSLGAVGGTEVHTLGVTQIPAHTHGGGTSSNGAFDTGSVPTTGASLDHVHFATSGDDSPDHAHLGGDLYDAEGHNNYTVTLGGATTLVNAVNPSGTGNTGAATARHQHAVVTGGMRTVGNAPTDHNHNYQVSVGPHSHTITTDNGTGGGLAHLNMQPSLIMNYIVLAE